MKFSIHTGNHFSNPGIADTVRFLKFALQDCGQDARINTGIDPARINLVMEHFVDDASVQRIRAGFDAGARFILIGTEPIINGVFNGGIDAHHAHYSNSDYWRKRYDAFVSMIPFADAIWVLAEGMVADYQALAPNRPVLFLPHGHVQRFEFYRHVPEQDKDIDFYFSGSLTEHRKAVLQALSARYQVIFDHQHTPDYLRFDHLSRSRVCLSLRLSQANVIPSVSRMHFHLQHGNYLLHERYPNRCALDPYVLHIPVEELIESAEAALALPARRETAAGITQRFRAEMPMSRLLPPILDASLARAASRVVSLNLCMP